MTKKEIVKTICERANKSKLMKGNLTQLATKEIVQWTFEAIIDTLVEEGRIELRNFGVFEVKQRKPRKARNPKTGDPVSVEAKNVVTFQPGKEMEERVRNCTHLPERKTKSRKNRTAKTEEKPAELPLPRNTHNLATEALIEPSANQHAEKTTPEPVTSDAS